jgi:homocysteine S-methyltransferase
MSAFRSKLPQLASKIFLTDAGLETAVIFIDGVDLPYFASFPMLDDPAQRDILRQYFMGFIKLAQHRNFGFILDTPTWRASSDWGAKLGRSAEDIYDINRKAVEFAVALRGEMQQPETPIVINGVVGPRGDGYRPGAIMTPSEAEDYHDAQVGVFASTPADMVSAITMNNTNEAIGIANAARKREIPVVISFTVETNGDLPTGQPLSDAIAETDDKTGSAAAYFMVNCAHPAHFRDKLKNAHGVMTRIRGIRANASTRSHAELDEATELDIGDIEELARDYAALRSEHPQLSIFGGCCGTDHRHMEAITRQLQIT